MSRPGYVTVQFKVKYLWLVVGLLLVILAVAPVVASYMPATTSVSAPPSNNNGSSGPQVTCGNPCTIYIKNSVFGYNVSQTQYVKAGTTVIWKNIDDTEHTATSNSGVWDSGVIPVGHSFQFTFNTPGTYPYHCNIHPMAATIVVVS